MIFLNRRSDNANVRNDFSKKLCYALIMDMISLAFYAAICGILSYFAPNFGPPFARLGIGAVVGIIAATLLPILKGTFGVY